MRENKKTKMTSYGACGTPLPLSPSKVTWSARRSGRQADDSVYLNDSCFPMVLSDCRTTFPPSPPALTQPALTQPTTAPDRVSVFLFLFRAAGFFQRLVFSYALTQGSLFLSCALRCWARLTDSSFVFGGSFS
jgi:hypothetical protein